MTSSSDVYLYFSEITEMYEYCELGPKTFKKMGYELLNNVEKIKKIPKKKNGVLKSLQLFISMKFQETNGY